MPKIVISKKKFILSLILVIASILLCSFITFQWLNPKERIQFTSLKDLKTINLKNTNYTIYIEESSQDKIIIAMNNTNQSRVKLSPDTYAYSVISLNNKNYLIAAYLGGNSGNINYQVYNITKEYPTIITEMVSSCWEPYLKDSQLFFDKITNDHCDDLFLKDAIPVTFDL